MMPVTPTNLMSFIDAPVPFVLGLQYKTQDITARWGDSGLGARCSSTVKGGL